jgi:cytochrome c553
MNFAGPFRYLGLPALVLAVSTLLAAFSQPETFPQWAFPGANKPKPTQPDGAEVGQPVGLPGAHRTFREEALRDPYAAPDWFPDSHPPAPAVVLNGRRGTVAACGYCHLPDGSGRPENASLSGLPADYIRRQVLAFREGFRTSAAPDYVPSALMAQVAANATDAEIDAAAAYFASIPARAHVRVVETDRITGSEAKAFLLRAVPGGGEALGDRIVEGPDDFDRFERRDPRLVYTAYVPRGALKWGQTLARTGGSGRTVPCSTCHGDGLRGGTGAVGPPLAGRSPSYLFRQLYGFSIQRRGGEASLPMQAVVARLTETDMIALAAYAGSLKP